MAMQQINLYQVEFRKVKEPLSAAVLLNIVVIVCAILVALYGYNYWGAFQARQQLTQLQQKKTTANNVWQN